MGRSSSKNRLPRFRFVIKTKNISLAIDQYLHSGINFIVPLIAAAMYEKSDFSYIAYHLLIASGFIGILNSTNIYFSYYSSKDSLVKFYYIIILYLIVANIAATIFKDSSALTEQDSIILYCTFLLAADKARKNIYLIYPEKVAKLIYLRIFSLLIALGTSVYSFNTALLAIHLLPAALIFLKIPAPNEVAKNIKDYQQGFLFIYSYCIATIPVYVAGRAIGTDIFADTRILQLIFSGGAFLLMPLEINIVRSFKLNKRSDFTRINDVIKFPKFFMIIYITIGITILYSATMILHWFNAGTTTYVCLIITWISYSVISISGIRLKAQNKTGRQYLSSTVNVIVSVTFIIAITKSTALNFQEFYALYLTAVAIVTALLLTERREHD